MIRRFYWAQLRKNGQVHIVVTPRARNPVEGDRTECGLHLKGHQKWWTSYLPVVSDYKCKRCYR